MSYVLIEGLRFCLSAQDVQFLADIPFWNLKMLKLFNIIKYLWLIGLDELRFTELKLDELLSLCGTELEGL